MVTPQQKRLLLSVSPTFVPSPLLSRSRQTETQWPSCPRSPSLNFFADVSFYRPGGRTRRIRNRCDSAEIGTSPNPYANIGLRPSKEKKSQRQNNGGGPPATALGSSVSRSPFFLFPGGKLCRTNNRGDSVKIGFSLPNRSIPE